MYVQWRAFERSVIVIVKACLAVSPRQKSNVQGYVLALLPHLDVYTEVMLTCAHEQAHIYAHLTLPTPLMG
jgi:hypothetical protein